MIGSFEPAQEASSDSIICVRGHPVVRPFAVHAFWKRQNETRNRSLTFKNAFPPRETDQNFLKTPSRGGKWDKFSEKRLPAAGKGGGNLEKRLPAAGRGNKLSIASRRGRERATIHSFHGYACLFVAWKAVWRPMQSFLSSKGHKKRSCRRGVTPASLRAVHSGRIMGQEAVPSREGAFLFYRCLLLQ